jgi:two-component system, NarL family, response regulator NreC
MFKLRVLLVDDQAVVSGGLKLLIDAEPDMEVVGEAANAEAGGEMIRRLHPDVVVVDLNQPVPDGIASIKHLQQQGDAKRLLILTTYEERSDLTKLLNAGVVNCLLKRSAASELIHAVRTTGRGNGQYLDSGILKVLLAEEDSDGVKLQVMLPLSERERAIVRMIAQGLSTKEIAAQLHLSAKTVETYKTRSMSKLKVRGRAALVRHAIEQGWLKDS